MIIEIAIVIGILFVFFYKRMTSKFKYFDELGLKCPKPSFPFGTLGGFMMKKIALNDCILESYKQMEEEKVYGMFFLSKPFFCIKDPELIKQVIVKDFDHFVNRRADYTMWGETEVDKIWAHQLTEARDEKWKNLRIKFTPIFTSGKMKRMLPIIGSISEKLVEFISSKGAEEIETREIAGMMSLDTIAAAVFGMEAESFKNENSPLVKHAKNIFSFGKLDSLKLFLITTSVGKKLLKYFNIPVVNKEAVLFFMKIITDAIELRKTSKEERNDLMTLMIKAMKDDIKDANEDSSEMDIEKDMKLNHDAAIAHYEDEVDEKTAITATAMVMLVAGYGTTANTLSYALYEMAMNPDVQKKLQDEIDEAFESTASNGFLNYEAIQSLHYLEMVIYETLRIHTVTGLTTRGCKKDYRIPGTNIIIPKKTVIWIPIVGIHMDPKYYPMPYKFNPENFCKENKEKRHPYTFLPFGAGPRSCIGMRFALLELKVALAGVLRKFNIVKCSKTVDIIELDAYGTMGEPKSGLYIKANKRSL